MAWQNGKAGGYGTSGAAGGVREFACGGGGAAMELGVGGCGWVREGRRVWGRGVRGGCVGQWGEGGRGEIGLEMGSLR